MKKQRGGVFRVQSSVFSKPGFVSRWRSGIFNTQHSTSNTQHPREEDRPLGRWQMGAGRWMFLFSGSGMGGKEQTRPDVRRGQAVIFGKNVLLALAMREQIQDEVHGQPRSADDGFPSHDGGVHHDSSGKVSIVDWAHR